KNAGYSLSLQTNGISLADDTVRFIKQNDVALGISCDGFFGRPEQLRRAQDNAAYPKRLLKTLAALSEHSVQTGITCVVTSSNVNTLEKLFDFLYPLESVRSLHFSVVRLIGRAHGRYDMLPDKTAYRENLLRTLRRAGKYACLSHGSCRIEVRFFEQMKNNIERPDAFKQCHAIRRSGCYVKPNGDIFPCPSLSGEDKFRLGDVFNGVDQAVYPGIHRIFNDLVEKCRICPDIGMCGGACLAREFYNGQEEFFKCAECRAAKSMLGKGVYAGI
ncbi:MAG: SPASM domain-containing protein, partial [Candidatus Omnitrophota bacterium]|nr:SPASM domain-containing protein [Candidatus Omnitrophota bacterium]